MNLKLVRLAQLIAWIGPLTTLVVTPWISFDPISLPKLVVVVSLSFASFALLMVSRASIYKSLERSIRILFCLFLFFSILTLLFSSAPIGQQFWGVFGRNTGFLAYISLMLILVSAAAIGNYRAYRRVLYSLVITAVMMTAYCLVQIFGQDPIRWSYFDTFGTLGNINFLSAFLGISSIVTFNLIVDISLTRILRLLLALKVLLDLVIVLSTGSIQGIMIFIFGVVVSAILYIVKKRFKFWKITLVGLLTGVSIFTLLTVFGLGNSGPLARFLYQPSVVFRGDYWHAGFELTRRFPLLGAGFDSYGDYYREVRGEISTIRTGPDRISNTAHNIFLDISSSGGFPLILVYLLITLLVVKKSISIVQSSQSFDPIHTAFFSAWVAYQIQSLVSINQLGVGIWGFIFAGCLLGYPSETEGQKSREKLLISKKFTGQLLSAKDSMLVLGAFGLGLLLAVLPFSADLSFRSARNTGSAQELIQASNSTGATLFHKEVALDLIAQSGESGQSVAQDFAQEIVKEYPRSFYAWTVLYGLRNSDEATRATALSRLRALDPFNPNYR